MNYEREELSAISGQPSAIGDPQGSAGKLRNADFGLRIGQSELGVRRGGTGHDLRITNHESRTTNHEQRTTQKLQRQTNPTRRKLNASKEKGWGLPQSGHDRRRRAAGPSPAYLGASRGGAGHARIGAAQAIMPPRERGYGSNRCQRAQEASLETVSLPPDGPAGGEIAQMLESAWQFSMLCYCDFPGRSRGEQGVLSCRSPKMRWPCLKSSVAAT